MGTVSDTHTSQNINVVASPLMIAGATDTEIQYTLPSATETILTESPSQQAVDVSVTVCNTLASQSTHAAASPQNLADKQSRSVMDIIPTESLLEHAVGGSGTVHDTHASQSIHAAAPTQVLAYSTKDLL